MNQSMCNTGLPSELHARSEQCMDNDGLADSSPSMLVWKRMARCIDDLFLRTDDLRNQQYEQNRKQQQQQEQLWHLNCALRLTMPKTGAKACTGGKDEMPLDLCDVEAKPLDAGWGGKTKESMRTKTAVAAAYKTIAVDLGLKPKDVKAAILAMVKVKPASKARSKKPCVLKAQPKLLPKKRSKQMAK